MIRLPMDDLAAGERQLDAEQTRYVVRVHRLRAGDTFVAFDPKRALEADGEVLSRDRVSWRVRIGPPRAAAAATRSVTWIHGCPKGDKADAIVRDATELGATRITFVHTTRIVAKPPASRVERWARVAREAARQCGRADAPAIAIETKWAAALAVDAETRVCLDPRGVPLRDVLSRAHGSIAFAAGPEGGLTEAEVDVAEKLGFVTCKLGAFVMRTETAPAAVLGALALFS